MTQILSIDGGGYLGLATAVFIRDIERHFGVKFADEFMLFCGTSTGAIITLGLAAGKTGEELSELYKTLGTSVFGTPSRGVRGKLAEYKFLITAKYQNTKLEEALRGAFGKLTLGDIAKNGKKALITSFSVTNGTPRLFKTDHSSRLTLDSRRTLVDIALASTAAPTFFPVVKLKDPNTGLEELFCDGGVVANHPALLGFAEAISEMNCAPADVSILSLSTPRMDLSDRGNDGKSLRRGVWGWRKTLSSILVDGNSKLSGGLLKRIVQSYPEHARPRYCRVELENREKLNMDDASPRATQVLEHVGTKHAASNDVRDQLANFFNKGVHHNGTSAKAV